MNEPRFGDKVRHLLNQGLEVDAAIAERLRAARAGALAHQRRKPAPVLERLGGWAGLSLRVALPAVLVVFSVTVLYSWHERQRIAELAELDTRLLADELPIEAYLDEGFEAWLRRERGS